MKIPDIDDIDLGIVAITIITSFVGIALVFTSQVKDGLDFLSTGVTAIGILAGRKMSEKSKGE